VTFTLRVSEHFTTITELHAAKEKVETMTRAGYNPENESVREVRAAVLVEKWL
jgi:hypothetical protein